MKKITFFMVFLIIGLSSQVFAQSRPFIGYDKVAWGVSVADVIRTYQLPDTSQAVVSETDSNITTLTQENVSASIIKREFLFNQNKLYRVWVYYKDISDNNFKTLQGLLESRYGTMTDFDSKFDSAMVMFQTIYYTQKTYIFGKFAPDIEVELTQVIISDDPMNLLGLSNLRVGYTWKKFRDEYQSSKLGL